MKYRLETVASNEHYTLLANAPKTNYLIVAKSGGMTLVNGEDTHALTATLETLGASAGGAALTAVLRLFDKSHAKVAKVAKAKAA